MLEEDPWRLDDDDNDGVDDDGIDLPPIMDWIETCLRPISEKDMILLSMDNLTELLVMVDDANEMKWWMSRRTWTTTKNQIQYYCAVLWYWMDAKTTT
jgi:hypothetical protein